MSKGRILWVDDEVDLLRPHTILLEREGYRVDAAFDAHHEPNDADRHAHRTTHDPLANDDALAAITPRLSSTMVMRLAPEN